MSGEFSEAECAEDGVDVLLHGREGQVEGAGDVAVGLAVSHLAQDVVLARGQRRGGRLAADRVADRQVLHRLGVDRRGVGDHRPDGGEEFHRGVGPVLAGVSDALDAVLGRSECVRRAGGSGERGRSDGLAARMAWTAAPPSRPGRRLVPGRTPRWPSRRVSDRRLTCPPQEHPGPITVARIQREKYPD